LLDTRGFACKDWLSQFGVALSSSLILNSFAAMVDLGVFPRRKETWQGVSGI
jgi:hypothetical protein